MTSEPDAEPWEEHWLEPAHVRRLAGDLVRDEHDADDLVQEALLYALERPPHSPHSLRAWFRKVLRNMAINRVVRDTRRRDREAEVAEASSAITHEEVSARIAQRQRVIAAVQALDEPYRTTVYLRYFEDLTPTAIAQRLQISGEAVKSRLRRGRERLRARLGAEEEEYHGLLWALLLGFSVTGSPRLRLAPLLVAPLGVVVATAVAALLWVRSGEEVGSSAGGEERSKREEVPEEGLRAAVVTPVAADPEEEEARREVAAAALAARGLALRVPFRVQDPAGRPLAGVRVVFGRYAAVEARTGDDGRGVLEDVPGFAMVRVHHPDVYSVQAAYVEGLAPANDLVLVASTRSRLLGRVLDERGDPIADAKVSAVPQRVERDAGAPEEGWTNIGRNTHTGDLGWFELGVPRGVPLTLIVKRFGWPRLEEPFDAEAPQPLVLTLRGPEPSPTLVTGTIVDTAGLPVAGAYVSAGGQVVQSDAEGRYRLDPWLDDALGLVLEDMHGADRRVLRAAVVGQGSVGHGAVAITRADREVQLVLTDVPRVLTGSVRGPDGEPLRRTRVWLRDPTAFTLFEGGQALEPLLAGRPEEDSVLTDAEGRFRFEGLLDREYLVAARRRTKGPRVEARARAGDDVALLLDPQAPLETVAGRVLLEGVPFAGATVRLLADRYAFAGGGRRASYHRDVLGTTVTDAEGAYRFDDVPRLGTWALVHGEGVTTEVFEVAAEPGPEADLWLERRAAFQLETDFDEPLVYRFFGPDPDRPLRVYAATTARQYGRNERTWGRLQQPGELRPVRSVWAGATRLVVYRDGRPVLEKTVSLDPTAGRNTLRIGRDELTDG